MQLKVNQVVCEKPLRGFSTFFRTINAHSFVFRKIVNRHFMCCDGRFFPLCGRASRSFKLEIVKANVQTIEWTFSRNGSLSARLFHSILCTLVFIRAFVFVRPRSFAACVPVMYYFMRVIPHTREQICVAPEMCYFAHKYACGVITV